VPNAKYVAAEGYPWCGAPLDLASQFGNAAARIMTVLARGTQLPPSSLFAITDSGSPLMSRTVGTAQFATCVRMAVVIPANAHVTHVDFFATDGGDYQHATEGGCSTWRPDQPRSREFTGLGPYRCAIGSAAFDDLTFVRQGTVLVIGSVFRAWNGEGQRLATMVVDWDLQDTE
jgi:hypothetical protein